MYTSENVSDTFSQTFSDFVEKLCTAVQDGDLSYFTDDVCSIAQECAANIALPSIEIEVNYKPYFIDIDSRTFCREVSPILYAVCLAPNDKDSHYAVLQKLLALFPEEVNRKHKLQGIILESYPASLHIAATRNNVYAAKLLIEHGADMLQSDGVYTSMHIAAGCGSSDVLSLLIKHGCDVNQKARLAADFVLDQENIDFLSHQIKKGNILKQPLHLAAARGHARCVQVLLEAGAKRDRQNKQADTAVHLAAKAGYYDVLKILIDYGAKIDIPNAANYRPLRVATENGHTRCVEILVEAGADKTGSRYMESVLKFFERLMTPRDVDPRYEEWPLHVSAALGKIKYIPEILDAGVGMNSVDGLGNTAVHYASEEGHTDCMKYLIKIGANFDSRNRAGKHPLHQAVARGHLDCARILIEAGSDVNSVDIDGDTSVHMASQAGRFDILKLLIQNNAKPDMANYAMVRPLHLAASSRTDCVHFLLDNNAVIDAMDMKGCTALHRALKLDRATSLDTVKLLMERGCDLNSVTKSGPTALHYALKRSTSEAATLLIRAGCCLELTDSVSGRNCIISTLLSKLSFRDKVNIVIQLSESDLDLNASDEQGNTALHYMSASSDADAVKIMRLLVKLWLPVKDALNARKETAVMYGIKNARTTKTICWLIDNGFDVNTPDKSGKTPLRVAAEKDLPEVVHALLLKYTDANVCATKCMESVMRYGGDAVLKMMLQHPVTTYVHRRNDGNTATTVQPFGNLGFHSRDACTLAKRIVEFADVMDERHRSHQYRVIRDIIKWDSKGRFDEMIGVSIQTLSVDLCKLVVNKRNVTPIINSRNANGETPLAIAVDQNSFSKTKLLLDNGAHVSGDVILNALSHGIDHTIVDLLLEAAEGKPYLRDVIKQSCLVNESVWSLARRSKSERLQSVVWELGMRNGSDRRSFHQTSHCMSTLKRHANSSWSPDVRLRHNNNICLTQLVDRCRLLNQCAETKQMIDAVRQWLNHVSNKFESDTQTKHLAFTPRLVGSMAEGTKVFLPNEFDFICELKAFKCVYAYEKKKSPGVTQLLGKAVRKGFHLKLRRKPRSDDERRFSYMLCDPRQLANNFYDCFGLISSRVKSSHPNLVIHKSPLQLRDKISCLHLLWNGTVFKHIMIYIDLVPAICLPKDFQPRCDRFYSSVMHTDSLPYHAVAKKSRYNFSTDSKNRIFPYSFSLHEADFISNLPETVKHGYTLAKALRQADICEIDSNSAYLQYHDPDARLYIADVITTYMLKTCLFFLYKKHAGHRNILQQSEKEWAIRIYRKVRVFVKVGKLPTFYGDGVLFQCTHVNNDVGASCMCCHKRVFITRMCDAIIQWLHEHRAELQELEDVYEDCRLEVYNRDK